MGDADDLNKKLEPSDISNLSRADIRRLSKNMLPGIESDRKELQSRLDTYSTCKDTQVVKTVFKVATEAIRDARTWCSNIRSRYNKLGCDTKPLEKKIHENLAKFTRESELNIFEFLRRFEQLLDDRGTEENKAELLHENYLSEDLKDEILPHKKNFENMKTWLIQQCGDVKDITRNIIIPITKTQKPSDTSTVNDNTSYYRKFYAGLQKIQELRETQEMPKDELQEYIYSNEFLRKLTALMPSRTQETYMDKLQIRGLDPFKMKGEETFNALAATVSMHFKTAQAQATVVNKSRDYCQVPNPKAPVKPDSRVSIHHQAKSPSTDPSVKSKLTTGQDNEDQEF